MRKLDTHWKSTISDLFLNQEYNYKHDLIKTLWEKDYYLIESFLTKKENPAMRSLKKDIDSSKCVEINQSEFANFKWYVEWCIWKEQYLNVLEYLLRKNIYKTNQIISPFWDWQILQFELDWELYYYSYWKDRLIMTKDFFQQYVSDNKLLIFSFDEWIAQLKKSYSMLIFQWCNKESILSSLSIFLDKNWLLIKDIQDKKWNLDFSKLVNHIENNYFVLNNATSVFNLKLVIEWILWFLYFYNLSSDQEDIGKNYWIRKGSLELLWFMNDTEGEYKLLYEDKKTDIILNIASIINVTWNINLYGLMKELAQVFMAQEFTLFSYSSFAQYCIKQLFFHSKDYECSQYVCTNWTLWMKSIEIDNIKYFYRVDNDDVLFLSNDWMLDYCWMNKHYIIKNPNNIGYEFNSIIHSIEKKWYNSKRLLSEIKTLVRAIYLDKPNVFMDKDLLQIGDLLWTIDYVDSTLQLLLESIFMHLSNKLTRLNSNNESSNTVQLNDIIEKHIRIIISEKWIISKSDLIQLVMNALDKEYPEQKDYFVEKYFNEYNKELKQIYNLDPNSDLQIYWFMVDGVECVLINKKWKDFYMSVENFIIYENKNMLLLCEDISQYQDYLINYLNNCIISWISWGKIVLELIDNDLLPQEMIIQWMSRQQFVKNINYIFPQTNFINLLNDIKHNTPSMVSPFQFKKILQVLEHLENNNPNRSNNN